MYNHKHRDVISLIDMIGAIASHVVMPNGKLHPRTHGINTCFSAMPSMALLPSSFLFKNIPL